MGAAMVTGGRKWCGRLFVLILILLAGLSLAANQQSVEPADRVLVNGQIITMDERQPEAQALAICKDTIAAVGSNEEIRQYIGSSTIV